MESRKPHSAPVATVTPNAKVRLNCENAIQPQCMYQIIRRTQDIVLSVSALAVLALPMLVITLVIWLDSPGASPIFTQERVGLKGKVFRIRKFRSMIPDAESRLESLIDQNMMNGPVLKIRQDPRITRVGRFLRKTGLDELPQLVNILRGEMSIVGPRPALLREVAQYSDYQRQRLSVTPGLTCYWQIQPNRNEIPFEEWVEMDLAYIRERSFVTDWKIIWKTFAAVYGMYGE